MLHIYALLSRDREAQKKIPNVRSLKLRKIPRFEKMNFEIGIFGALQEHFWRVQHIQSWKQGCRQTYFAKNFNFGFSCVFAIKKKSTNFQKLKINLEVLIHEFLQLWEVKHVHFSTIIRNSSTHVVIFDFKNWASIGTCFFEPQTDLIFLSRNWYLFFF